MSRLSGLLTPELRAAIEAMLAKLAAPGACNPEDETPVIDAAPDEDAVRRDSRSEAQRNHDVVARRTAGAAGVLRDSWVKHNGSTQVSIVVTTTLKDLEAATGKALTGGGTLVPMSDVIRWASHAHHYLAIFDRGKPLALYHTKRLASPAQRIMLYGKERGCTMPGCDAPAYHSQVHHVNGWTKTHRTDIDRPHPGLRTTQPARRKRLDHPHQRQRRHRMVTTAAPGSRSTPHQHVSPSGETPATRRRRTRLTPATQPIKPGRSMIARLSDTPSLKLGAPSTRSDSSPRQAQIRESWALIDARQVGQHQFRGDARNGQVVADGIFQALAGQ